MKINNYVGSTHCSVLFVLFALAFASCSKDDGQDSPESGKGGVSMVLEGETWNSTTNTLLTKAVESENSENYHLVAINALRGMDSGTSETLSLYINIPAHRFENPIGSYPVAFDEEELDHSWALLKVMSEAAVTLYVSADPDLSDRTLGSLEIKGFEIGDQQLPGQNSGEYGYTRLVGSFQFELHPVDGTGGPFELTEGQFDLRSGFDF